MNKAILLVIICAIAYHPSQAQIKAYHDAPQSPLSFMLNSWYTHPEIMNTQILGKYQSQIKQFAIVTPITFTAIFIGLVIMYCGKCSCLKGTKGLIIECTVILAFLGIAICTFYKGKDVVMTMTNSYIALNTTTADWNQSKIAQPGVFAGIRNYYTWLSSLGVLTDSAMTYANSMWDKNDQLFQTGLLIQQEIEQISNCSQLMVSDPTNTSYTLIPAYLSTLGPMNQVNTVSYNIYNLSYQYYSNIVDTSTNIAKLIESSNFYQYTQIYGRVLDMLGELKGWYIEPFYSFYYNAFLTVGGLSVFIISLFISFISVAGTIAVCGKKHKVCALLGLASVFVIGILTIGTAGVVLGLAANGSQTCQVLNNAFNKNDVGYQTYIMNWVKTSEFVYDNSTLFIQSCFFQSNAASFLYNYPTNTNFMNLFNSYIASVQQWESYIVNNEAIYNSIDTIMSNVSNQLHSYKYDMSSQYLPYSLSMLQFLNSLTTLNTATCQIQDVWVYDVKKCPEGATVIENNDPSFGTYPIGPLSCLALDDINTTMFNLRYNQQFINNCDPNQQIYSYYYPLSVFAQSGMSAFSDAISYVNSNAGAFDSMNIEINEFPVLVENSTLTQLNNTLSLYLGASPSSDICSNIKADIVKLTNAKCQYGVACAWEFMLLCLCAAAIFGYLIMELLQMSTKDPSVEYIPIVARAA